MKFLNVICGIGAIFLAATPIHNASAQLDPLIRYMVVPAAVEIALILNVTEMGTTKLELVPIGSGTIISAGGHVLTNQHVVDMDTHSLQIQAWEDQASANGVPLQIELVTNRVMVLTSDGVNPPGPAFRAAVAADDPRTDLAVLEAVEDSEGLGLSATGLTVPFVTLGDSDSVRLGDSISVFGYPTIAGGSLTYTAGVVSGFLSESGIDGPAWINTDAVVSGGSSGGTAVDRYGRLGRVCIGHSYSQRRMAAMVRPAW